MMKLAKIDLDYLQQPSSIAVVKMQMMKNKKDKILSFVICDDIHSQFWS